MSGPSAPPAPTLVRALGVRSVAAIAVNAIVGSGIFVLPAAVAAILGATAPIAYVACALVVGLTILCFAEAGSRVPRSGGTYAYVEAAFGRYPGFIAGTLYWFGSEALSSAALAVVLAESIAVLIPPLGGPVARMAILGVIFGLVAIVNVRGVRKGVRLIEVATTAKLLPLLVVAVAGLIVMNWSNLTWHRLPTFADLGRASLVLFFAFQGAETAVTPSGEIVDPTRTIPKGLLLALATVTVFYAALQMAAQGVLGDDLASHQAAPLAEVARRVFGPGGLALIAGAAAVSAFGTIAGSMLAGPRLLFGFAEDGLLPGSFGVLHPRFRTPSLAIVVHAAVSLGFALTGTFRKLAVLSGVATLLVYLLSCLATIVLKRRGVQTDQAPFELPGGPTIPILATVVIVWFLVQSTMAEVKAIGWAIGIASAAYLLRPRRATARGVD